MPTATSTNGSTTPITGAARNMRTTRCGTNSPRATRGPPIASATIGGVAASKSLTRQGRRQAWRRRPPYLGGQGDRPGGKPDIGQIQQGLKERPDKQAALEGKKPDLGGAKSKGGPGGNAFDAKDGAKAKDFSKRGQASLGNRGAQDFSRPSGGGGKQVRKGGGGGGAHLGGGRPGGGHARSGGGRGGGGGGRRR